MTRRMTWSLGVAGILVLGLLFFLYTPPGLSMVGRLAAPLTGGQVRVAGLGGFFPGRLHAARVELADGKGIWLRVDDARLEWSALALLGNHIDVQRVSAAHIAVLRRPLPSQEPGGETPRIDIEHLTAPLIELGAPVIGQAARLSANGNLHFVSMQEVTADLLVTRTGTGDRYRISGGIQNGIARGLAMVMEGPDGILGKLAGLPGLGAVNLSAQAAGDAAANTVAFRLSAGSLTANGHGTIALATRRADIDATLAAPAMAPRPDLSWQALSGDLHLHGRFDAPQLNGHLMLTDGRVADVAVKSLSLDATGNEGQVALQGTAEKLILPGDAPNLLAGAPLRFTVQADLQSKARQTIISLDHPLARLRATAQTLGPLHVVADLTLPSLAPFSSVAQTPLAGNGSLHAVLDKRDTRMQVALDGALRLTGANLAAKLLGNAQLALTGTMDGDDITASHITLNGSALKADLEGALRARRLNYTLALDLTDLSRLAGELQGTLTLKGTAAGPTDKVELAATGSALMATKGFARQRVAIELKAAGLPALSSGSLAMGGRLDGAPLSLRAALTGDKIRRATLLARWRSLDAQADLSIAANGAPGGTAKLAVRRLSDIAPFIGADLAGAADASVNFRNRRGATDADVNAEISGLRLASVTAQTATIRGSVSDVTGRPLLNLDLAAGDISAQGWKGGGQATLRGPLEGLKIALNTSLADANGGKLEAQGEAQLNLPDKQLVVSELDGSWRALKFSLDGPSTVHFADGLLVERLAVKLGQGRIIAAGQMYPNLSLRASADAIALADFQAFLPGIGPQGTLSGTADVRGSVAAPTGRVNLRGRDLRAAFSPGGMPAGAFALTAQLMGDHAALDVSMDAGPNVHLTVAGNAPLKPEGAMALHVAGNLDLALLDALTAASGRRIRGTLTLDGDIAGTLGAPSITGRGSLANGEVQDYIQGVRIHDIAATLVSDGKRLTVSQLTGRAGPGTLSASGSIDLLAPNMPIDMKLEMQNARPIASDLITPDLSGSVTMTGHVRTTMTLAGQLQVIRATINLPDNFPPEVAVLNVRRRGQPPAPPPAQSSRVQLDLAIRTTGPVFVRGRGMDADMGGNLRISGTTSAPVVAGGLRMNRGTFSAAGQTLKFTSGTVRFDGTGLRGRLDPLLDFVAQTVSSGVTATFAVTGYASAPKITLSSTPQLPQDEVIAHLLFQQSVKQLTPLQLASIAQAAAAMGGIGGGFNPLGAVRRTLGLDRLSVGSAQGGATGTESQTTVEAGRYVARNVYVGVRQNLAGGTQTQVQVDITRRLKAQATLSTGAGAVTAQGNALRDNGSNVGLSYQFQY